VADSGDHGADQSARPSVALPSVAPAVIDLADNDPTSWLRGLHRRRSASSAAASSALAGSASTA
jgi:hypothetical protein